MEVEFDDLLCRHAIFRRHYRGQARIVNIVQQHRERRIVQRIIGHLERLPLGAKVGDEDVEHLLLRQIVAVVERNLHLRHVHVDIRAPVDQQPRLVC